MNFFSTWLHIENLSKDKIFWIQFLGVLVLCLYLAAIVLGRMIFQRELVQNANKYNDNTKRIPEQILQSLEKSLPFREKKNSLDVVFEDMKDLNDDKKSDVLFEEGGVFFISKNPEVVLSEITFLSPKEGEVLYSGENLDVMMQVSNDSEFRLELRSSNFDCYQDKSCELMVAQKSPVFILDNFSNLQQREWEVGLYKGKKNFLGADIPEDRYVLMAVDKDGKILGQSLTFIVLNDKSFRNIEFYNPIASYNQLSLSENGTIAFMWSVIPKVMYVTIFLENKNGVQTKIADNIRNVGFFVWRLRLEEVNDLKKSQYKVVLKDQKGIIGQSVFFGLK